VKQVYLDAVVVIGAVRFLVHTDDRRSTAYHDQFRMADIVRRAGRQNHPERLKWLSPRYGLKLFMRHEAIPPFGIPHNINRLDEDFDSRSTVR
jgi:hypothetical protein